ncbi:Serine/threonine-protein kinase PrkC [Polystyrenella longa]|uniref:Serine/threonine-protein kinase PrkC n=1 Tax=Polystyrenella longa TaxID=2528007 RepID=A0A518CTJ6_9PLAN|nr:serine/threonine-protein kinase [Polystyrenella longa]QDU82562.1 Serine/threonine-protein kinase PrkC [Polystyrenella longa]
MSCPNSRTIPELRTEQFNSQELNDFLDHVSSCDYCYEVFRSEQSTSNDSNLEIEVHEALENSRLSEEPECREVLSRLLDQQDSNYFQEGSAPVLEPVSPGTILGDFYLEHVIARGGMGTVYAAEQISLKRRVAFKLINTGMQPADGVFQRFTNEAMALSRMDHPQIIPVLTCGHCGNSFYLVMPLIDGINLANLIQRLVDQRSRSTTEVCATTVETDFKEHPLHVSPDEESSFVVNLSNKMNNYCENYPRDIFGGTDIKSPEFIRNVVQQFICLADALQYVHDRGIIHRDIKPSNILIDREGKMRIGDFGVAKLDDNLTMTATHQLLGTPRYMSPEQIPGNKRFVDHRTDIYSLGITLYELLTLKSAFESGSIEEIMFRIEQEQPFSCRIYNPAIPLDLETIILKSIEKSSEDRYVSASLLANDLRRFLENKPVLAKRPGPSEHIIKWISRHRSAAAAIVAGMALMLIMSIVILAKVSDAVHRMEASQKVAEESLDQAIETTYASSFALGFKTYQDDDISSAAGILDAEKFVTEKKDYRGFEWPLLMQRIRGGTTSIQLSGSPLYRIAESHDRKTLAVAGQEALIFLVNASDYSVLSTIHTKQKEINDLDFSMDDSRIISAGDDGTICIWDCQSGKLLMNIPAHDSVVYFSRFCQNDNGIISHSRGETHVIWDPETGNKTGEFRHLDSRISISCLNKSKRLLATINQDQILIIYDLKESRIIFQNLIPDGIEQYTAMTFSPDSQYLYFGRKNGLLARENLLTKEYRHLTHHRDEITAIEINQDGSTLYTADIKGLVKTFRIPDPHDHREDIEDLLTPERHWKMPELTRPGGFDLSSDGKWACVYNEGNVFFLSLQTGKLQSLDFPAKESLRSPEYRRIEDEDLCCFSPDGKWLTFLTEVYQLQDGQWGHYGKMQYESNSCFALDYLDKNRMIIVSTDSGLLKIADTWKGTINEDPLSVTKFKSDAQYQSDVIAVSRRNNFVAVNTVNNDILLYDMRAQKQVGVFQNNILGLTDMNFSPDESTLAVSRYDTDKVEFWSTAFDGVPQWHHDLDYELSQIECIEYSPDGKWLATATSGNSSKVLLWNLRNKQVIWFRPVQSSFLKFSPDNQKLYTFDDTHGELISWDLSRVDNNGEFYGVLIDQDQAFGQLLEISNADLVREGETFDVHLRTNDHFVSVGEKGRLSITSINQHKTIKTLDEGRASDEGAVGTQAITVGGKRVVTLREDLHLESHLFANECFQITKVTDTPEVVAIALSPQGNHLITGTNQGTLQSRDPDTLHVLKTWPLDISARIERIECSNAGDLAAIQLVDPLGKERGKYLSLLNLNTGAHSFPFGADKKIDCFSFAKQHDWLACGIATQLLIRRFEDNSTTSIQIPKGDFGFIDFSPSDDLIAAACSERKVLLGETATGEWKSTLLGFDDKPKEVRFTPDGQSLVAVMNGNQLKIWNVNTKLYLMTDDYLEIDTIRFSDQIPGFVGLQYQNIPVFNYLDYDWNQD